MLILNADDIAGLILSVPGVLQCWAQQADEPATIDVFVRVTDDRRDTLRAWLPELIRDHAATAVHARVHVVDHLQLPETS